MHNMLHAFYRYLRKSNLEPSSYTITIEGSVPAMHWLETHLIRDSEVSPSFQRPRLEEFTMFGIKVKFKYLEDGKQYEFRETLPQPLSHVVTK